MRLHRLFLGVVLALAACTHDAPPPTPSTASRSTAQLLNTYWKLTRLGEQVISTPAGAREVHFVLHSENQSVSGFSGCNRMMGSFALDADTLKFDQLGGTLMACVSAPDNELERKFLAMFPQVARWKIDGENLSLLNSSGKTIAGFESRYL
jgi:heat shock protein HslJ